MQLIQFAEANSFASFELRDAQTFLCIQLTIYKVVCFFFHAKLIYRKFRSGVANHIDSKNIPLMTALEHLWKAWWSHSSFTEETTCIFKYIMDKDLVLDSQCSPLVQIQTYFSVLAFLSFQVILLAESWNSWAAFTPSLFNRRELTTMYKNICIFCMFKETTYCPITFSI